MYNCVCVRGCVRVRVCRCCVYRYDFCVFAPKTETMSKKPHIINIYVLIEVSFTSSQLISLSIETHVYSWDG